MANSQRSGLSQNLTTLPRDRTVIHMMDEESVIPFGSDFYWLSLSLLFFGRAMDFLSTWVATPNLVHEANPLARRLGWKWGGLFNVIVCFLLARWPFGMVFTVTVSLLAAAHNFKFAWIMRTMGEQNYRLWMSSLMAQTSMGLVVSCLLGETLLTILVGLTLIWFSLDQFVPRAIGVGIVAYGGAVAFYTMLSIWRGRHRMKRDQEAS